LALELGKVVSEREAQLPARSRVEDRGPPPEVRIGTDSGGAFGASDGTRLAELAKADQHRQRPDTAPPPPPAPEVLARIYLTRAGFARTDLDDVTPLLRRAEDSATVEQQMKPAGKN
jgi:hypothetical protein